MIKQNNDAISDADLDKVAVGAKPVDQKPIKLKKLLHNASPQL